VLLIGIIGYFGCRKIISPDKSPTPGKVSANISEEQYLKQYQQYIEQYIEFLKKALTLNIRVKEDTAWVYIANKSNGAIPSGKLSRVIICSTELFDLDNKLIERYPEYFKASPEASNDITSEQLAPLTTVKFGYDLTIPHGIIKVKLTYEDLSMTGRGEDEIPAVPLVEQEITF
jgi:hypothetical protein